MTETSFSRRIHMYTHRHAGMVKLEILLRYPTPSCCSNFPCYAQILGPCSNFVVVPMLFLENPFIARL